MSTVCCSLQYCMCICESVLLSLTPLIIDIIFFHFHCNLLCELFDEEWYINTLEGLINCALPMSNGVIKAANSYIF